MSKLPKDWKVADLRSLGRIESGGTPDTAEESNWNGSINWCTPSDITALKNKYLGPTVRKLSHIGLKNSSAKILPVNSVIVCTRATIGECAVNTVEMATNQGFKNIVPNGQIDAEFLYYAIIHNKKQLLKLAAGSTFGEVSKSDFGRIRILLPSYEEQRGIGVLLSCWDRAIEQTEKLVAAKTRIKRGLLRQLLTGQKRFKEFDGQEWRTKELKDIGEIESGGTPDTSLSENWGGLINWCTPTDITALQTRYLGPTVRKLSERGLKNSSAKLLPPNSVIVCTRATIGDCAINTVEMATNQGFKSIVPNENVNTEFLYYSLVLSKKQLLRLAAGSTFGEVSKSDFERITISLPPVEEQRRIAAVLNACDKEITLLKQQLDALKRQKRGLMQKLLTGQIRVKV
jgi:type I restriction enzyme S subunit